MSSVRSSPGSTPLLKPAVPCAGRLPAGARCRRAAAPPARAAGAGLGLAHFDRHPGARPSPGRRQGGGSARPRGTAPFQPSAGGSGCPRRPWLRPRSVSPRCPGRREPRQRGPRARPAPASPCPAERSWYGPASARRERRTRLLTAPEALPAAERDGPGPLRHPAPALHRGHAGPSAASA